MIELKPNENQKKIVYYDIYTANDRTFVVNQFKGKINSLHWNKKEHTLQIIYTEGDQWKK